MKRFASAQANDSLNADFSVSVVIPAHNAEEHVVRAVNSALRQTYSPVEVLVVDDASTDNTAMRVWSIRHADVFVLQRTEPGPGGYRARNQGIHMARGAWIAFLDADDEWSCTHLEKLCELHAKFPRARVLSSSWRVVGAASQARQNHYLDRYRHAGCHELDFDQFLRRWSGGTAPIWTSAACARWDVLQAVGGFPAGRCTRGGDVDTWLRIMLTGTTLAYSPEITAIYHRDVEASVTRRLAPQVDHCTMQTISSALAQQRSIRTRLLLKRLANTHRKDPIRKRARAGELQLRDLKGFYPAATPGFFFLSCLLALAPHRLVRFLLTVRDRTVSMWSRR
jgi:GT2 family glycosyltransferase